MMFVWFLLGGALGALLALWGSRSALRVSVRRQISAERRARDAERLAEIGAMTGGLAHEIKNPLSTIGLNAQLLGEAIEELAIAEREKAGLGRRAAALTREVERLRDILEDFLRYAGEFRLEAKATDIAAVVREFGDFFEAQALQDGARLRIKAPAKAVGIVDASALKQALLNLSLNAVQAMTPGGGELVLSVSAVEDDDIGGAVEIAVADSGPGVAEEKRAEIFRPYITGVARGRGLGLRSRSGL